MEENCVACSCLPPPSTSMLTGLVKYDNDTIPSKGQNDRWLVTSEHVALTINSCIMQSDMHGNGNGNTKYNAFYKVVTVIIENKCIFFVLLSMRSCLGLVGHLIKFKIL